MNFIDKAVVPVEIDDKKLPIDNSINHQLFGENSGSNTESGFVSGVFLLAIMVTCFMFGMIVVIAIG